MLCQEVLPSAAAATLSETNGPTKDAASPETVDPDTQKTSQAEEQAAEDDEMSQQSSSLRDEIHAGIQAGIQVAFIVDNKTGGPSE